MARNLLGQLLLSAGVIDEAQLEEGLKLQERTGKRLGEALVELGGGYKQGPRLHSEQV